MKYKTLIFKDKLVRLGLGPYASMLNGQVKQFGGSNIPTLQPETADIETMKKMYPLYDFDDVEFITLGVNLYVEPETCFMCKSKPATTTKGTCDGCYEYC